ncbi:MAG: sigma-70 family RNA polymerase sigma factor [Acidimicrobiales bacterium]
MRALQFEGVDGATGGDAPAVRSVEALYRRDHARLVGLAHWLVGDRAVGEEIVQEVFADLLVRETEVLRTVEPAAYARRAVVNRCRSRIRRLVLERRHAAATDDFAHEHAIDPTVLDRVLALPIRQRQCVVLRFYEDLTVDQIADDLGISAGSVKTHLHRAMKKLAVSLGAHAQSALPGRTP